MSSRREIHGKKATTPLIQGFMKLIVRQGVFVSDSNPICVADVGCGDGATLCQIKDNLAAQKILHSDRKVFWKGYDLSPEGVRIARQKGVDAEILNIEEPLSSDFSGEKFDLILFSEVLEHLVDTDTAVRNLHRLLKPNGLLILSTPNLAAWYNRIFLLFGFQPHCTEVSYEPFRFGNQPCERLLGKTEVAGHLRLFSYRALRQFMTYHGFKVKQVLGVAPNGDRFSRLIARYWVGGAGDVIMVLAKA
jgi:SAM-dependent methyltransferase